MRVLYYNTQQCEHEELDATSHTYPATRFEPAEDETIAVCRECGQMFDLNRDFPPEGAMIFDARTGVRLRELELEASNA